MNRSADVKHNVNNIYGTINTVMRLATTILQVDINRCTLNILTWTAWIFHFTTRKFIRRATYRFKIPLSRHYWRVLWKNTITVEEAHLLHVSDHKTINTFSFARPACFCTVFAINAPLLSAMSITFHYRPSIFRDTINLHPNLVAVLCCHTSNLKCDLLMNITLTECTVTKSLVLKVNNRCSYFVDYRITCSFNNCL